MNIYSKNALSSIISVLLLLLISVSVFVAFSVWYNGFTSSYDEKKLQSLINGISDVVEIKNLQNESGNYTLYLKSNLPSYLIIDKITLNTENCTFLGSNVILKKSVSKIELNCLNIKKLNTILIESESGLLGSDTLILS